MIRRIARAYRKRRRLFLRWRVKRHKSKVLKNAHLYDENPAVAFIVLSFNHRHRIRRLTKRLRLTPCREYIICEDGSIDGSLKTWDRYLDRPNDFVLRSNDLHEIRAYDRAIGLSRSAIICLLQDDDVPPKDPKWYTDAVRLFEMFPGLVVLGGWCACYDLEQREGSPGDLGSNYAHSALKSADGIPFLFAEMVNIGPYFIRKRPFLEMGGFNFEYSPVGWAGIHFDFDLCLRTWLHGGQVGWYHPAGFRSSEDPGTEIFGHRDKRVQQRIKNYEILNRTYADRIKEINGKVLAANQCLMGSEDQPPWDL